MDQIIHNSLRMFPLVLTTYFIFEAIATSSVKSAIVVFGILLVTFFGKLIHSLFGKDPGSGDINSVCKHIFDFENVASTHDEGNAAGKDKIKQKKLEMNTLIYSFLSFYINGQLFTGNVKDISSRQFLLFLFLHFMIFINARVMTDKCNTGIFSSDNILKVLVGSYIIGVILSFVYFHFVKAIEGNDLNLLYNDKLTAASGESKCGLNKKKEFKCRKILKPKK